MILRIEVQKDGQAMGYLYRNGREIWSDSLSSMADLASRISKKIRGDWTVISGIYVFRGPAGYSRLRSSHSFVAALSLVLNLSLYGYLEWNNGYASTIPTHQSVVISPVYSLK